MPFPGATATSSCAFSRGIGDDELLLGNALAVVTPRLKAHDEVAVAPGKGIQLHRRDLRVGAGLVPAARPAHYGTSLVAVRNHRLPVAIVLRIAFRLLQNPNDQRVV